MNRAIFYPLFFSLISLILAACGPLAVTAPPSSLAPSATHTRPAFAETAAAPTATARPAEPVLTALPTITPAPALAQVDTPTPSATSTATPSPSPTATATPTATITPTPTATPLPTAVLLTEMPHEYQKLNNCGPVSLAMVAGFYEYPINQFEAAEVVKGGPNDKNVTTEEMVAYLRSLGLEAVHRVNGNEGILRKLLAHNIPVIVHQWLVDPEDGRLAGHYRVVRGYDAQEQVFIVNDPFTGPNLRFSLSEFDEKWRPFERSYIPVYRAEQTELVADILGSDWERTSNFENALAQAQREVQAYGDGYAYYNLAQTQLALGQVETAAASYLQALSRPLPERFTWYHFGHLAAFNQTEQHQRVLNLTTPLLRQAGDIEEVRYQRGLAYQALANRAAAEREFQKAVTANPRFTPAETALKELQTPPQTKSEKP